MSVDGIKVKTNQEVTGTGILYKSTVNGPALEPHQLSDAVITVPVAVFEILSPSTAVFPINLLKIALKAHQGY